MIRASALLFPALVSCTALGTASTEPADRTTELDGLRIHYVDAGSGADALVLVHGWSCDATFWRFQTETLAERARVLAVDLPGHGKSDKPEMSYTMDLFADAVAAAMDDAGVERAVVVGHSNGTPVARQFWRRHPERTLGLVVVDGALKSFFEDAAMAEIMIAPLRNDDYIDAARVFVNTMLPPTLDAELAASIRDAMLATPQHVMIGGFEAANDPAIWSKEPLDVPVLCVMAESPWWTEEYEAFVAALCPDLDYRVMSGVSHFLMMERPEEFNAAVLEFLDANGPLL